MCNSFETVILTKKIQILGFSKKNIPKAKYTTKDIDLTDISDYISENRSEIAQREIFRELDLRLKDEMLKIKIMCFCHVKYVY